MQPKNNLKAKGQLTSKNKPNFWRTSALHSVVKWGHTEGIPREKSSSQKYTVITLYFWRDEFFLVFQIWGQNTNGGQYRQDLNALIFWYKYLQKVNAMPSDFWWKKNKFCSIDEYFFNPFFKGSKVICQRGKTFFFHRKSEGIAFTFCRYLNQNMRVFKFCRYCLQNLFRDAI